MTGRLSARAGARHPLSAAPALLVLAFVAACGGGASASSSAVATTTVDLPVSYKFVPAAITVDEGATVTWTNHDNFTHNVDIADDTGDPLFMKPGESVTFTFAEPGTFAYQCSLHPQDMKGTVLVTGG